MAGMDKEEAAERARRKKEAAAHNDEQIALFFGSEKVGGVYPRAEWDTPAIYDERNPPGRAWSRMNYRLNRMEWSFDPIPAEHRDDYNPKLYAKMPDGKYQYVGYVVEGSFREVLPTPSVAVPDAPNPPKRRYVLPRIDKSR